MMKILNYLIVLLVLHSYYGYGQKSEPTMMVGVATVDITPKGPILLAGYGERKSESEGVLMPLYAKAIAFGSDAQKPSVLITVDLIGIQWYMTKQVSESLAKKTGLNPANFVICATHTHTGPEIGNLINHFSRQLPPEEIGRIDKYLQELAINLEKVALDALKARAPARLAWGQGKATFAMNRRKIENGKSVGMSATPGGPTDESLPVMTITGTDGKLKGILISYACHGTTLGGDINHVHGDWMGEAQKIVQERHPGVTALVSLGCGADANPEPRLKMEYTVKHGTEVADEVDRLLKTKLTPVTAPPSGKIKMVELPYDHVPDIQELVEQTQAKGSKGYFAKLSLDRIARGEAVPSSLTYPVQTWTFGNDLAMVFLAGEVVVDYSLRIKRELGNKMWVHAYSNDVPCYIASARVIREGGYEVEYSMYSYNRPSKFSESVEDIIINAVYDLLPASYKQNAKKTTQQQLSKGSGKNAGAFRASVVKVDITPDDPQILQGYAARTSTGIHDRIYHRIVALDDGNKQFFLVSSDICTISPSEYDNVASVLHKQAGIDPINFWWSVTHTHSAPEVGVAGLPSVMAKSISERYMHQIDTAYTSMVKKKLIQGIEDARRQLASARLGVGWGFARANINRRAWDTDGIARGGMNPDGPVDRRIGLIRLDHTDGTPMAFIANYSMHGTVLGPGNLQISGDAPGIVSEYVEEMTGAPVLYINGAAGNLAPIYSVYPSPQAGHLDQFKVLLGNRIIEANKKITVTTDSIKLFTGSVIVKTPRKDDLGWPGDLTNYTEKNNGKNIVKLPVRFLNISNEIAIWSAPLELFCEISMGIRERSPFPYTFYYGYTNGWMGYLGTEEEWKHKGYEIETVSPYTISVEKDFTEPVVSYIRNEMYNSKSAYEQLPAKKSKKK